MNIEEILLALIKIYKEMREIGQQSRPIKPFGLATGLEARFITKFEQSFGSFKFLNWP